jgi:zinc D-Ala-D-Ala carboxypeptidase
MIVDSNETVECTKHFSRDELKCSFAPDAPVLMDVYFMEKLEELREEWGRPMRLSSAYRTEDNPRERSKPLKYDHLGNPLPRGGMHARGRACDVLVAGADAVELLRLAVKYFNGIGINQKGEWNQRFIHLDDRTNPAMWSY